MHTHSNCANWPKEEAKKCKYPKTRWIIKLSIVIADIILNDNWLSCATARISIACYHLHLLLRLLLLYINNFLLLLWLIRIGSALTKLIDINH